MMEWNEGDQGEWSGMKEIKVMAWNEGDQDDGVE